ncbi:MAG: hypothetical protein H6817_04160 [Phycisphaerales bacterium]|nr:hypothetical protein [Phycisphaerales bacterium]
MSGRTNISRLFPLGESTRRSSSEVLAAKAQLLELMSEPRDRYTIVREHPLACTGAAFLVGMIAARSSTIQTAGRVGLLWGLRSALASTVRGLF